MEINRYHVFCSTALRSSGTSSDFSIQLNPPLTKKDPHSYFVAQIVSVEIPYTWVQVNASNNSLVFVYQVNGGTAGGYTIQIPDGNYNINTLMEEYGTQIDFTLNAAGLTKTWTHNLTYNSDTGRVTFNIANASAYTSVSITPQFWQNTFLGKMFGVFLQGSTSNGSYGWTGGTYFSITSGIQVNVNPVSSIYIRSSNLRQIKNQENLVAGFKADPSDILCKIQIYTQPRSWIFYNGELGFSCRVANNLIDRLDIYLSDNYTFGLDMNTADWTFRITFIEYMPFNMGSGYEQTKHLQGNLSSVTGNDINEMSSDVVKSEDKKENLEVPLKQIDRMVTKKFQRD